MNITIQHFFVIKQKLILYGYDRKTKMLLIIKNNSLIEIEFVKYLSDNIAFLYVIK